MILPAKKQFHHNRKRNTGLVYEFLLRHLAHFLLEKKAAETKKIYQILEKYFAPSEPLFAELQLFEAISQQRQVNESTARRTLAKILQTAASLEEKSLDIKKSNLIKEINYTLGKNFFSLYRLPHYRFLASLQMLFNSQRGKKCLSEDLYKIQLEEAVVSFMQATPEKLQQRDLPPSRIDNLVFSVAEKKFQEAYAQVLSVGQKQLLERFGKVLLTKNPKLLEEQLLSEKARLLTALRNSRNLQEIKQDRQMQEKLETVIKKIAHLDEKSKAVENNIEEIMLCERLVEELKSHDQK